MLFSEFEKFRITRALGFPEYDRLNERVEIALDKITDPQRYARIIQILDKLDQFDEKILAAVEKSFVQQVDTIKLNYMPLISHLKAEATRCLNELAYLADLDIQFNKFTGEGYKGGRGNSPHSVRSLC